MKKFFSLLALILVCFGAVSALQHSYAQSLLENRKTTSAKKLQQQTQAEKTGLELLKKAPTFGFDNLMADWTFLRFLQYFGDEQARNQTGYNLSLDYFDIIIEHDPRFLDAYIFLSASGTLYAAQPERTVALMDQGLEFLTPEVPPRSYYIWRYKATDELLFLGEPSTAQTSYETAAQWARQSPDPDSDQVATASQRTADFLAQNPDSRKAQVNAWADIARRAVDEETIKRASRRIEDLGGKLTRTPNGNWRVILPQQH